MLSRALLPLFLLLSFLASACAAPAAAPPAAAGCAPPVPTTVEQASNFSVRSADGYDVLTVEQPSPGAPAESYVLVHCGATPELPPELAAAQRIQLPVTSLYSGSTTHLPLLVDLERLDVLTGVATAAYVTSPQVNERIASGAVAEYAPTEQIDAERVIAARPGLLMTGGFDDPAYATMRAAGVPVVANAEYLEQTPLGRAEWIKVMGALTGEQARAQEVFDRIEADYLAAAALAEGVTPVPVVAGSLFQGTWAVPAGGSYLGTLIKDAGGTHPWESDPSTSSLTLDFETVFSQAGQAPVWLATQDWRSRADAVAADARHGELAAFGSGRIWTTNKVIGPGGGNDFYERGVTRPDLVLGDLVAILHPERAPGHEFAFYTEVT